MPAELGQYGVSTTGVISQRDRGPERVNASASPPPENSEFEIDFHLSITSIQVILHVAQLMVHV
mgnify:FL=1